MIQRDFHCKKFQGEFALVFQVLLCGECYENVYT
jgi:hypothetical protein